MKDDKGSGSFVRSRMRIRNDLNNRWLNLADCDAYVRDPDNLGWLPLFAGEFSIRDQTNARWIDIDNLLEPDIDDPCSRMTMPGSCNGGEEDTFLGSGNGKGSFGKEFDTITGYPPGYDLPDAGVSGFGLEQSQENPTGWVIRRPGADMIESYQRGGVAADNGDATFANPAPYNTSVFGTGAAITEFFYVLGKYPGYIDVTWISYGEDGASVDVYYLGERRATSCGKHTGRGRIRFYCDPEEGDGEERIMIRVRTSENSIWTLQVRQPTDAVVSEVFDLKPDYYKTYPVSQMPDVLSPPYLGTPVFPAPCHASVYVRPDLLSSRGHFEYYHHVGTLEGWMYLDYKSWNNEDIVEVYHYGRRIATTLDPQTKRGFLHFWFDPRDNDCQDIMVRVICADPRGIGERNSVYYALWCPDTRGAREFRHPCEAYEVASAGHPTTEDNFDLGVQNDLRAILVQVDSGNHECLFELVDENDAVIDATRIGPRMKATLEAWKAPTTEHQPRCKICVRVTSAIGSDWSYLVYCPIQPPKIRTRDHWVPHRCIQYTDALSGPDTGDGGGLTTLMKRTLRFWGNVDHRLDIHFRVVNQVSKKYTGSGYGRDLTPAVAAIGGYFLKTDEQAHGDLWSNIKYDSWLAKIGEFPIKSVDVKFTWTGSVQKANIIQEPNASNGWMCIIRVYTPSPGEQYLDLSLETYANY